MSKYDDISALLTDDILRGQYRVGERLPSERDLAARFDANRGAVREAMKKLEQLGLASIQPGGARVRPIEDASLDIIGTMLGQGHLPDERLVDQVLQVVSHLVILAADTVVREASDETIADVRKTLGELIEARNVETHEAARFDLLAKIMRASNNLVCQLIARALLDQFVPNMQAVRPHANFDRAAYDRHARRLDNAFAHRDAEAVRSAFESFAELNRRTMVQAMDDARRAAYGSTAS